MTPIWTHEYWSGFRYDAAELEPLLEQVSVLLGQVLGIHSGLSGAERERIILMEITQEALQAGRGGRSTRYFLNLLQ